MTTSLTQTQSILARALAIVAMAAFATACGGGDDKAASDDAAGASAKAGKKGEKSEAGGAAAADDGMANAVAVGKTAAAVDLKYDIETKPSLGQPFEIELVLVPRVAADVLEVEATGMPGLVIASGATARFEKLTAGERYGTKVLVQVMQPGLYYVGVTAKLTSQIQTDSRVFSVPVVVGTPPAEQKPAAAAAAGGAAASGNGETIKSMPAVETTTPANQPATPPAQKP